MNDRPKNSRLDFRCCRCAATACFGDGVHLLKGESGRWYCLEHVPVGFLPGSVRPPLPLQSNDQGRLL